MSLESIYFDTALKEEYPELPGSELYEALQSSSRHVDSYERLQVKLEQACRKLCLMWQAAEWAAASEMEFWTTTVRDAPALFGQEQVTVHYHLEAFVLFARSALDVAANPFGWLLPPPFARKRYDSFSDLVKSIGRTGPEELKQYFQPLQTSDQSWLSVVSGLERGRSLRDKISHQTEFPLAFGEHQLVVPLGDGQPIPLPIFLEDVRKGVVDGFVTLETACVKTLRHDAERPADS